MYLHCIRSLHFLRAVSNSFLDSARLHSLHILGWFPYFFFQHTDLVYIRYILWDVFPIYFHCIRLLHFLKVVSNSVLDSARLHPLHILGWFPYVFSLYTFVTLFRGFLIFFFNIQILYTSVTSYGMFFLYISIVYIRYTFCTSVTYTWVVSLCICFVYVRYTF